MTNSKYDGRVYCPDCNSADAGHYAGHPYCGLCEREIVEAASLSDLHDGNLGFTTPIYTAAGVGL